MSNEIFYPTASTSSIFINGIHIEQAFRVDFRESMPRTPIYGYNDTYFSKVAIGKSLIQGMLIVNFTLPFYLNYVLTYSNNAFVPKLYNLDESLPDKSREQYKKLMQQKLATELPSNDEVGKAARARYIASVIKTKDRKIDQATIEALYKSIEPGEVNSSKAPVKKIPESIPSAISDNPLYRNGVILDVYYNEPDNSAWFTRFNGVHFFDVSQQINQAGAEGSSEPLYEIYSFIAQKRETRLVK